LALLQRLNEETTVANLLMLRQGLAVLDEVARGRPVERELELPVLVSVQLRPAQVAVPAAERQEQLRQLQVE
jgi:hypothetical protein